MEKGDEGKQRGWKERGEEDVKMAEGVEEDEGTREGGKGREEKKDQGTGREEKEENRKAYIAERHSKIHEHVARTYLERS